jgi:hypothetical protein
MSLITSGETIVLVLAKAILSSFFLHQGRMLAEAANALWILSRTC